MLGNRLLTGLRALVDRLHEADKAIMRRSKEFVHKGKYAAEVAVDLIEDDTIWPPYLSPDDARKLDTVRLALRLRTIGNSRKAIVF